MRKILRCVIIAVLLFSIIPLNAGAVETDVETSYFADGSYATVEVIANEKRISGSKTADKVYTYYNSDDVAQWKAILTGSFNYTGSSSTCSSSSMSVVIYDSSWYTISKSATKSNNVAMGVASIGKKVGGVTVMKVPVNLTLTCDANGNLS